MLLCVLQRSAGLLTIAIDCIDSVTGYGVYTIYAIADLSPTYLHSFNYAHSYGCIVYDSVLDMKNKKWQFEARAVMHIIVSWNNTERT